MFNLAVLDQIEKQACISRAKSAECAGEFWLAQGLCPSPADAVPLRWATARERVGAALPPPPPSASTVHDRRPGLPWLLPGRDRPPGRALAPTVPGQLPRPRAYARRPRRRGRSHDPVPLVVRLEQIIPALRPTEPCQRCGSALAG